MHAEHFFVPLDSRLRAFFRIYHRQMCKSRVCICVRARARHPVADETWLLSSIFPRNNKLFYYIASLRARINSQIGRCGGQNNLINRANLINPPAHRPPSEGKSYDSCSRKLACSVSVFCTFPRLSIVPAVPYAVSPINPRSSPTRFTLGYRAVPGRL